MKLLAAAITIGLIVLAQPKLEVTTAPSQPTLTVITNSLHQKTVDGKTLQGGNL